MSCPTCRHRKADGILRGSPALRDQKLCYFHPSREHSAEILRQLRRYMQQASLPLRKPREV